MLNKIKQLIIDLIQKIKFLYSRLSYILWSYGQRFWQSKILNSLSLYFWCIRFWIFVFESTKPIRVNDEWLTDKRGKYSISELYSAIDALYKTASDIWDSHTAEGNPFKQRNGKIREVSKITASAVTILLDYVLTILIKPFL